MGHSLMSDSDLKKLGSKDWKIVKIEKHFHHGDGLLFAYSMHLAPPILKFRKFWLYIRNDTADGGALIQLTSPSQKSYSCGMDEFSMEPGLTGCLRFNNVRTVGGDTRDLKIELVFDDMDDVTEFVEISEFFGF